MSGEQGGARVGRLRKWLGHKFLRDTLTLQTSSLFNAFSNLATTVLLAHLLGARVQGQYYVALSLYALLFFLLNQGVHGATVSQVAAASARGLHEKVAAWLGFLVKAYALVGLLLVALGFLFLPWFATRIVHADAETTRWTFWLTLTPFCELPKVVTSAALQGTRRMVPFARIENGAELLRFFGVSLGALVTGSALGPVLGGLGASLLASVIALGVYARVRAEGAPLPRWREILGHARDVSLRAGLPLGMKLGFVRSIDAVGTQALPTLILQHVSGPDAVAYMRIAQRLLSVPLLLMQGVSRNVLPMFSELAGLKDLARFRRLFVRASLASGGIISLGILCVLPSVPWIVSRTFPAEYHHPVSTMALILVPGFVVMSFSIANDTFYLVTNTLRAGMQICAFTLVLNVLVVWYLAWAIPFYGVAWGLSFTYATASLHYAYEFFWFRRHQRERELPART
ncbi:MAG: lipopolysaccharide biosynthesis protein [Planctomycetes bacterium]|nr:lipopolysaccharide biosynthesis protein [Planctomycetota bacterium]